MGIVFALGEIYLCYTHETLTHILTHITEYII